jgi:hypothetical protein
MKAFELRVLSRAELLSGELSAQPPLAWLAEALHKKAGQRSLCLMCDAEFTPAALDWSFVSIIPFDGHGKGVGAGICRACASASDAPQRLIEKAKHAFGGVSRCHVAAGPGMNAGR